MVDGAVADQSGRQQARWQVASGFDTPLAKLTASFLAPSPQLSPVDCFAGPIGSNQRCTLAELDHTGVVRLEQNDVRPGDRVDLLVGLPAGTTPANAKFADIGLLANAFALTPLTGIVFALLLVFLIAGAVFVGAAARRTRARSPPPPARSRSCCATATASSSRARTACCPARSAPSSTRRSTLSTSAPPSSTSPSATTSGSPKYPGQDWQIARRNPPDEHLHDFERAVYETLLPDGTDTVLVSQLRARGGLDLRRISDAMYTDVVTKRWFSRRPDTARGRLTWLGAGIFALGLVATAVLTFTIGYALLGVAVALAGLAVAAAAALLPSRTARGRVLAGQVRGLLDYLHTAKAEDIPPADRELVFSRSLPYAVVLGDTERWLGAFAALNPASDGSAGLYWYGGMEADRDLRRFGAHFPSFLTALDGLLTESAAPPRPADRARRGGAGAVPGRRARARAGPAAAARAAAERRDPAQGGARRLAVGRRSDLGARRRHDGPPRPAAGRGAAPPRPRLRRPRRRPRRQRDGVGGRGRVHRPPRRRAPRSSGTQWTVRSPATGSPGSWPAAGAPS